MTHTIIQAVPGEEAVTPATPVLRYRDLDRLVGLMSGDEKHTPSATSTLDVLWVLYDRVLRFDPFDPNDPERDRFLLSKGHGPMAYYAVLAAKGFIPVEVLPSFATFESPLGMHPDRSLVAGAEIASGSLGHGLPIAVGVALGLRAAQRHVPFVYCLAGDAELDEGSNHEAIALAGRRGLDHLVAIVIDNGSASYGWPGGIAARFAGEGWSTLTVDGRDHEAIEAALTTRHPGRPHAVVAVVEGKR
jgi:transketolase